MPRISFLERDEPLGNKVDLFSFTFEKDSEEKQRKPIQGILKRPSRFSSEGAICSPEKKTRRVYFDESTISNDLSPRPNWALKQGSLHQELNSPCSGTRKSPNLIRPSSSAATNALLLRDRRMKRKLFKQKGRDAIQYGATKRLDKFTVRIQSSGPFQPKSVFADSPEQLKTVNQTFPKLPDPKEVVPVQLFKEFPPFEDSAPCSPNECSQSDLESNPLPNHVFAPITDHVEFTNSALKAEESSSVKGSHTDEQSHIDLDNSTSTLVSSDDQIEDEKEEIQESASIRLPLVVEDPKDKLFRGNTSKSECFREDPYDGDFDFEHVPIPSDIETFYSGIPGVFEEEDSEEAVARRFQNRCARDASFLRKGSVFGVLAEDPLDVYWVFELARDYSSKTNLTAQTSLRGFYWIATGKFGAFERDPKKYKSSITTANILRHLKSKDFLQLQFCPVPKKNMMYFLPWSFQTQLKESADHVLSEGGYSY